MASSAPFPARVDGSAHEAELVEAIAHRVVELLREEPSALPVAFVDASEIARLCGVERSWVYAHATELGAIRLGEGPRARLRFDPRRVAALLSERTESQPTRPPEPSPRPRRRRRRPGIALLPIHGETP